MTKPELRKMLRELNKSMQANPLKTKEDHESFRELQMRYNDICELYHQD